jgi:hypothetical protein
MATGCGMVTCPSCGHEFPPESKIVTLVTSLLKRRPLAKAAATAAKAPAPDAVHGSATPFGPSAGLRPDLRLGKVGSR